MAGMSDDEKVKYIQLMGQEYFKSLSELFGGSLQAALGTLDALKTSFETSYQGLAAVNNELLTAVKTLPIKTRWPHTREGKENDELCTAWKRRHEYDPEALQAQHNDFFNRTALSVHSPDPDAVLKKIPKPVRP